MVAEPGDRIELKDVLLVSDDGQITVGTPNVANAQTTALRPTPTTRPAPGPIAGAGLSVLAVGLYVRKQHTPEVEQYGVHTRSAPADGRFPLSANPVFAQQKMRL